MHFSGLGSEVEEAMTVLMQLISTHEEGGRMSLDATEVFQSSLQ